MSDSAGLVKGMTPKEYGAAYRAKHKAKMRAYGAQYYLENTDKIKKAARDSKARNPARARAIEASWRAANPERVKTSKRKWETTVGSTPERKARKLMNERKRGSMPEVRASRAANTKKYREANPEKANASKLEAYYRSKYGITVAERDQMFEAQGKRCRICRRDSSPIKGRGFHLDHCHATKKVRGILCHHCNLMLGNAKDDIAILRAAIAYLEREK
jgi:hypothetical protein